MIPGDNPAEAQKELIKKTLIIALFPSLYALISGEFASLLGFLLGLIISLLLFRLKTLNITRALNMSRVRAETFIRNHYFVNYIIYFVVLFLANRNEDINFLATALGLLFLKFIIIALAIVDIIKDSWKRRMDKYT